jgi:hypothetical protein
MLRRRGFRFADKDMRAVSALMRQEASMTRHESPARMLARSTSLRAAAVHDPAADAELLALEDEFVAALARRPRRRTAPRPEQVNRRIRHIETRIAATPAFTLVGLMAKARCVALQHRNGEIVADRRGAGRRLAFSIAHDLIEIEKTDAL